MLYLHILYCKPSLLTGFFSPLKNHVNDETVVQKLRPYAKDEVWGTKDT